jgi:hypothetical protein
MIEEKKRPNNIQNKNRLIRIHPTWYTFIKYCEALKFGELEKLKIQDGLPLLAEEVKKKVMFTEEKTK